MSFLTKSDFDLYIKEELLDDMTDVDDTVLNLAIDTAISLAKDHLNARYDTVEIFNKTDADRHQSVVDVCLQLALYKLHQRLHPEAIPEHRLSAYQDALMWLKGVNKGSLAPVGLPEPDPETENKHQILYGSDERRTNDY